MTTSVAVAGSTGSIGVQTLEVLSALPDQYRVSSLIVGSSIEQAADQARTVRPDRVVVADEARRAELAGLLPAGVRAEGGPDAMADCAAEADVTINGVVGFAGLGVTLATLNAGKRLGLANKESLIAAGPIVQAARRTPGAQLVPVDSEHAAIHMALRGVDSGSAVARLQLTASGGPFRGRTARQLKDVTVDDALNHPTWSMGPKITVDSSTLMNKGLEVIEAHELFGPPAGPDGYGVGLEMIDVVVHPQSIVHSMVTLSDGATLAQLSHPDMRLPIGYALAFPDRLPVPYGAIDWAQQPIGGQAPVSPADGRRPADGGALAGSWSLTFEAPDHDAFPCLGLAFEAARVGETAPAWLNAANEVAVGSFLTGTLRWADIARVNKATLDSYDGGKARHLEDVLEADRLARLVADKAVIEMSGMINR